MASRICFDYDDRVESIYCDSGDINNVGKKLFYDYNTENNVKELIKLGDLKDLRKTLNETMRYRYTSQHIDIFKKRDDYCNQELIDHFARGRYETGDRSQPLVRIQLNIDKHKEHYVYMWSNNRWYYTNTLIMLMFRPLTTELVGTP